MSPNVDYNVIDNVENVVPVVVGAEVSKRRPKRSKRLDEKENTFLMPGTSTTTKNSIVSSKKKLRAKERPEVLKKNKLGDKGKKTVVKKPLHRKKIVFLKRKKVVEKEFIKEDVTNILDDMKVPTTKRSKKVVGGRSLYFCYSSRQCLFPY